MVGSRGSKLALLQTRQVMDAILRLRPDLQCRIQVIRTRGDAVTGAPLSEIGGTGVFVKEIEEALLTGQVDLAVHSAKDLPAQMDSRLCIAAYPEREDARDAVVSRAGGLSSLPVGANVGTGSLRRKAQLLRARPDLRITEIRGNLDTRIRKLDDGDYDAIVLACAGLRRMGLESRIAEALPVDICLPAAGQGALAVQCCEGSDVADILRDIDHSDTRRCVEAERAVLVHLGAGCSMPVGVLAQIEIGGIVVHAVAASRDGRVLVREKVEGDFPAELAAKLLASEVGPLLSGDI